MVHLENAFQHASGRDVLERFSTTLANGSYADVIQRIVYSRDALEKR